MPESKPSWIENLRRELLFAPMKDNYTLTRDELMQVMSWYSAVTDEGVITHVGWDENDARKSLQNIIHWHIAVAIDPKVSEAAQQLIESGRPKDHQIAQAVNQITEIARDFHHTQQLRQRISEVVVDLVKGKQ